MPLSSLPFITPELPGAGGEIKAEPDHFVVAEQPLYAPCGSGEHLFVQLTRRGQTTREVVEALAKAVAVPAHAIGYAGLKDRQARVTQVFSLPGVAAATLLPAAAALGYEVAWAIPNNTKLRVGHLLGNHFIITVLHADGAAALPRAAAVIAALQTRGLPNYFGGQRFGVSGDNAAQGLAILSGQRRRPGAKWLYRLLLSAYQSHLFNSYLALRIERGLFAQMLAGDLAKKTDTGGMFLVEDVDAEQPRCQRGEITFTGPLFGHKMRQPAAAAAALEAEVLATAPVHEGQWRQHRVMGNRRPGRLFLAEIALTPHPQGFQISFFLPKGAYATTLLREVLKSEPDLPDAAEEEA
ncbi:MAG: tRNA pseudouridine(13) synthase TruD [Caldilineales bacterium]|nr:tRNA pseudouridine(13) synthase TruD [Caldilineales bacterium]